ncbi:hypothetical protein HanXRQr2_Chr06g0258751 [Helianthus annuus]|uniref:Reverse transcriptase, RNA-dependent DNA polymerase n=1 Tax=Helianthus annuus TaxID=4232 RepID=A0A9K3NJA7_HELAN|nr:hypothetical protein HanXRQr2_Chr06g0258751 [Helianthus annuus]
MGLEVQQRSDGIYLSQKQYAKDILNRFGMASCKCSRYNPAQSQSNKLVNLLWSFWITRIVSRRLLGVFVCLSL